MGIGDWGFSENKCEYCATGYIPSDDKLTCILDEIHCEYFDEEGCDRCVKDYALNIVTRTCVEFKGCMEYMKIIRNV